MMWHTSDYITNIRYSWKQWIRVSPCGQEERDALSIQLKPQKQKIVYDLFYGPLGQIKKMGSEEDWP